MRHIFNKRKEKTKKNHVTICSHCPCPYFHCSCFPFSIFLTNLRASSPIQSVNTKDCDTIVIGTQLGLLGCLSHVSTFATAFNAMRESMVGSLGFCYNLHLHFHKPNSALPATQRRCFADQLCTIAHIQQTPFFFSCPLVVNFKFC
ncbi:hypothetical protein S83_013134 [Arachis hypogaea]